jgi:hypothetical protein
MGKSECFLTQPNLLKGYYFRRLRSQRTRRRHGQGYTHNRRTGPGRSQRPWVQPWLRPREELELGLKPGRRELGLPPGPGFHVRCGD